MARGSCILFWSMTSRSPKRPRGLSPEDQALWDRLADTVHPLHPPLARQEAKPEEPAPPPLVVPEVSSRKAGRPPAPHLPIPRPPASPPPLTHGATAGIDRRTADRFTRGKMTIDGRLDLHGHGREAAHIALNAFIKRHVGAGSRALLVITGKGTRGEGVLRRDVPQWLNDAPLRGQILSYSHAQPRDGGKGALYVLLKRRRED